MCWLLLINSSCVCAFASFVKLKIGYGCLSIEFCQLYSPFGLSVVVSVIIMFIIVSMFVWSVCKVPFPCCLKSCCPCKTCLMKFSVITITVCSCRMAHSLCLIKRLVIPICVLCISSSRCFCPLCVNRGKDMCKLVGVGCDMQF